MATIRRPDRGQILSLALLALLSGALALPARAQVPGRVNFQGLLLDSAGQPLTGTVSLQLQLFAAASGGSALWTETHAAVSVSEGIYDVVLGSLTPLTPALFSASPRYLQVTVNGQVLSPRREFVAVPFALKADAANSATSAGTATTAASAGFATNAGHATSADSATTAENVGGVSAEFVTQIYQYGDFDGNGLLNSDPVEGLVDTDVDGAANLIDADNDDDGLSDASEVSQGSDPNLATPTLTTFSPPLLEDDDPPTLVTITGTNFDEPGLSVSFGSETPTPVNVTATSFQVTVGPQPWGSKSVLVSLGNGESAQATYGIYGVITAFVTSTTYNGNLGGVAGADAKCQARASAAGLSGTYVAFIGRPGVPTLPLYPLHVFKRTDGAKIADNYSDLIDTTLDVALNLSESGAVVGTTGTWTGMLQSGSQFVLAVDHCSTWSSAEPIVSGAQGIENSQVGPWLGANTAGCAGAKRLYCFEAP